MKTNRLPWAALSILLLSLCYWAYLSLKGFSADAIGYKDLGFIFYHQGLIGYLTTGLHREPLYPLACSMAMHLEDLSGITFTRIMTCFSILMLASTQILLYIILRELRVRPWICYLTLLYWAVSPAIMNSAFNILEFCEIMTYPLILGLLITGYSGWKAVKQADKMTALYYGAITGILFASVTLVKAAFECICPVYLMFFLGSSLYKNRISIPLVCFLTAAGLLFYGPIIGYKYLNKIYNGNFAIADRGPNTLYGNVAHRVKPLTPRAYLANLASVAGGNVCMDHFKRQECSFWDFSVSDTLGAQKMHELAGRRSSPQAVTDSLLRLSKKEALSDLPQYLLLTATESLRAFFWEGTTGSFSLRTMMAVVTCFAVLYCCFFLRHLPWLMGHLLVIALFFIFFYSFFDILPRHILPIVPLYLICIGHCLDSLLPRQDFFVPTKKI